ncbi:disulfide bond formation protein B [Kiloniella sp. b19]|uniref:disulfide bond formation protein B n=1 Tax=Kiloniella sp. GXU_MW_B19 TaxID=3141326 RepID=UPI0031D67C9C
MIASLKKQALNPESGVGALLLFAASGAILLSALGFQYFGGLFPCVLCIYQRYAYGAAMAFAVMAFGFKGNPSLRNLSLAGSALSFLGGAATAFFHVGVEHLWWEGSSQCQGEPLDLSLSVEDLAADLLSRPFARCDQIPWDFLGLSMAGWNVILSLGLCLASLYLLRRSLKPS